MRPATAKLPDTLEKDLHAPMTEYLTLRGHVISWERKYKVKGRWISSRPPYWSDGIGHTRNGLFLAIETKRERGDLGEHGRRARTRFDAQRRFIQNVIAAGGVGLFAQSVEDLQRAGL